MIPLARARRYYQLAARTVLQLSPTTTAQQCKIFIFLRPTHTLLNVKNLQEPSQKLNQSDNPETLPYSQKTKLESNLIVDYPLSHISLFRKNIGFSIPAYLFYPPYHFATYPHLGLTTWNAYKSHQFHVFIAPVRKQSHIFRPKR